MGDTVVIVLAGRPAPIMTLENYSTNFPTVVLSDPRYTEDHKYWLQGTGRHHISVLEGEIGLVPQVARLYNAGHNLGFKYIFRLDDDLRPKSFVTRDGLVSLDTLVKAARDAAEELDVSLVGPNSTCNKFWLQPTPVPNAVRSVCHLTGGAQLFTSCLDPYQAGFIDKQITTGVEDVYRTLAHRAACGAIGRVQWIGFDHRKSCGDAGSLIKDLNNKEALERDRDITLARFKGMAISNGYKRTAGAGGITMHWKMKGKPILKPSKNN